MPAKVRTRKYSANKVKMGEQKTKTRNTAGDHGIMSWSNFFTPSKKKNYLTKFSN